MLYLYIGDVTPINTSTIVDSHFTSSTSLWTSSSAGVCVYIILSPVYTVIDLTSKNTI